MCGDRRKEESEVSPGSALGDWGQVDAFQGVGAMEEGAGRGKGQACFESPMVRSPSSHNKREIRYITGSSGEKSRLGRTSLEGGGELIKPVQQRGSQPSLSPKPNGKLKRKATGICAPFPEIMIQLLQNGPWPQYILKVPRCSL